MIEELIETVPCPLCESHKFKVLLPAHYPGDMDKDKLLEVYHSSSDDTLFDQLVECEKCSLVYLNPRIKEQLILESYKSAVDTIFIEQNENRIKTFKNSIKYISKKYDIKLTESTNVLDIGCAGGAFPKAASDLGLSVIGLEPSSWLAEQARNRYGLDVRAGVLEEHNFDRSSFDVVTLWDVIEHLTRPDAVINQIHMLLKDDGILVINYPDYDSWVRRFLKFRWPFFLSVHLIYFTPETIKKFLQKEKYVVVEIKPYFQTLEFGYILKRASTTFGIIKPLYKLVKLLGLAKVPFKYNMGQSMLVAKKSK